MSNSVTLYGIKNCDTVRKALKWLANNQIDTDFNDLKKISLDEELIIEWLSEVGQGKRGLTWRNLSAEERIIDSQSKVINLVQQNPSILKRPIYSTGIGWDVGFNEQQWAELFL